MNLPLPLPEHFGIVMHTDHDVMEYPMGDNFTSVKYMTVVWIDIRLPYWQAHTYTTWMFRDRIDEFGPVQGFDIPFDGVRD